MMPPPVSSENSALGLPPGQGGGPPPDDLAQRFLLVDKPLGWTSFDVVNLVKRRFRLKVGHAGTLDPLATGLLVLATGAFTRRLDEIQGLDKEYLGRMRLGATTPSHDGETEATLTPGADLSRFTSAEIEDAMTAFVGDIVQVPPMYSAIKVKGRKLVHLARRGVEIDRPARPAHVAAFELLEFSPPELAFRVECSKGTYVRSLAHDLGQRLGVGASLTELRRTRIGPHRVEQAVSVEMIKTWRRTPSRESPQWTNPAS